MTASLAFQSTAFDVVDRNGQPWIQSRQLASSLGYKDERSVHKIYERNKDEFTASMVAVVKLTTPLGGSQDHRIFSLRGCHLLAMFARTPVAKAFRVWVLDVLETLSKAEERPTASLPDASTTITPEQQCTLKDIIRAKVEVLPESERDGGVWVRTWARFNSHFRIARYNQLPQGRMSEAIAYLMNMDVRKPMARKELPLPTATPSQPLALPIPPEQDADLSELQKEIRKTANTVHNLMWAIHVRGGTGGPIHLLTTIRKANALAHEATELVYAAWGKIKESEVLIKSLR